MWGSNRQKPGSAEEALPKLKTLGAAIISARPYDPDSDYYAGDHILTEKNLSAVQGYNAKVRQNANDSRGRGRGDAEAADDRGPTPCVLLDELGRARRCSRTR